MSHLTAKNRPETHATQHLPTLKLGFTNTLADRFGLLVGFAVVYGLIFINSIDLITNGSGQGGYTFGWFSCISCSLLVFHFLTGRTGSYRSD